MMAATTPKPRWQVVAEHLQELAAGPTPAQLAAAKALSVTLKKNLPAPVAAVVLKHNLGGVLLETLKATDDDVPEALNEIEKELRLPLTKKLITDTHAEVSAWFAARYMVMTARGLRAAKPHVGDVVKSAGWKNGEHRLVSTIGSNGRVYMKRHPARAAWPNHLEIVARVGSKGYDAAVKEVDTFIRNSTVSTSTNLDNYRALGAFELTSHIPSSEAVRALEELLESGERLEEPLQKLIARHPALLAGTVMGGWKTYVIPKPKLGSEFVPDFLVLGINSTGPQWVTVEIEGARHPVVLQDGELHVQTRHAIKQIEDWRDWLTTNVSYVQSEKGFHGLTNRAPGLVIIGRRDPSPSRESARSRTEEQARIAVHSWEWLLRSAKNLTVNALRVSDFAVDNARELGQAPEVDADYEDILSFIEAEELED